MKWTVFAMILALALFAPSLKAQTSDHIEVGAFVDYFNLSRTDPNTNYVGVGGPACDIYVFIRPRLLHSRL